MLSQHDQVHGTFEDDEVTPHALVVVPDPTKSPVRALKPEDAVRDQRPRKRLVKLDDFTNPYTEMIKRSCK